MTNTNTNAATFEKAYNIRGAGRHNARGLTLYEARKALLAIAAAGDNRDATHASRDGRPVAFWNAWTGTVRPMARAYVYERANLEDWEGPRLREM